MRTRRFNAGDEWEAGGVLFRCVPGCKKSKVPGHIDLRLDWFVNGRWSPVVCDTIFSAFDQITDFNHFARSSFRISRPIS